MSVYSLIWLILTLSYSLVNQPAYWERGATGTRCREQLFPNNNWQKHIYCDSINSENISSLTKRVENNTYRPFSMKEVPTLLLTDRHWETDSSSSYLTCFFISSCNFPKQWNIPKWYNVTNHLVFQVACLCSRSSGVFNTVFTSYRLLIGQHCSGLLQPERNPADWDNDFYIYLKNIVYYVPQ